MVKAKHKRTAKKYTDWLTTIIMLIVGIGVGGLFVNGTFLSVFLLSYLPTIVHTVVGWLIIAGSAWNFISRFM